MILVRGSFALQAHRVSLEVHPRLHEFGSTPLRLILGGPLLIRRRIQCSLGTCTPFCSQLEEWHDALSVRWVCAASSKARPVACSERGTSLLCCPQKKAVSRVLCAAPSQQLTSSRMSASLSTSSVRSEGCGSAT